ncbi:MAG: glycosyltransferase, partial [Ilumatobacteraceae bacterium]
MMPADLAAQIAQGRRPRADYEALAEVFSADLLDDAAVARAAGWVGRLLNRALGPRLAMAWRCYLVRHDYDVIVSDGEQIGLPLAAMSWLDLGRRRPAHVMIAHVLSVPKKVWMIRLLRLRRRIDRTIVYSTAQRDFAVDRLHFAPNTVTLTSFMVDTTFFDPHRERGPYVQARPLICSAGLELRDYPTMIDAVHGLDADVVLAAASPWSKRRSGLDGVVLPANVRVVHLDLHQLRQLYARCAVVVMPLVESAFQAGGTTILEAMAMGKAIVCARTAGQTDTIIDGVT